MNKVEQPYEIIKEAIWDGVSCANSVQVIADKVLQALSDAGLEVVQGWQTMDTAPEDGTKVDLLYTVFQGWGDKNPSGSGRAVDCYWGQEPMLHQSFKGQLYPARWLGLPGCDYHEVVATHWRPVPALTQDKESLRSG